MDYTNYFNEDEYKALLENGSNYSEDKDDVPLIKLFMTNTKCIWLITELNPENPDLAFGLCDLGVGFPELGYVSLSEIEEAQSLFRYLERDSSFTGKYPISIYASAARRAERIVTDEANVNRFAPKLQQ